ncbi:MAG TPA: acyclic terpene utilization AtuA family protein, partial [Acetobacteraceae bacterium]|nr:acyclic terpene utilization AtuA family protein [Acetobacteraceae bacterium]
MSATCRLFAQGLGPGRPLRVLAASGQLGYGVPEAALNAGIARAPHFIGCDMGSIDVGPYYLGAGKLATTEAITRRDLRLVLKAALGLGVPLLIGTAGTAGGAPHLARTRALIHEIAVEEGLRFRMATIHADMPRALLREMAAAGRTRPLGRIPALDATTIDKAAHIVGQMGTEAFIRALRGEPDIILAGRACDTAIFAAIPQVLGYAPGPATHMAKIIECTSICCTPGGRDAILGTLEDESFVLESMNPARAATPISVAAHSLYEQGDPLHVHEPDGTVDLSAARYEQLDDRRTRVSGAVWQPARCSTIKVEGAEWCGERAVLLAGSCDPRVIANADAIIQGVRSNVAEIMPPDLAQPYELFFHVYGKGATSLFGATLATAEEIFFLVEIIAPTMETAHSAASVAKQYLLHHGFPGRLSTGGNIAFPF